MPKPQVKPHSGFRSVQRVLDLAPKEPPKLKAVRKMLPGTKGKGC